MGLLIVVIAIPADLAKGQLAAPNLRPSLPIGTDFGKILNQRPFTCRPGASHEFSNRSCGRRHGKPGRLCFSCARPELAVQMRPREIRGRAAVFARTLHRGSSAAPHLSVGGLTAD